ncbi:hypothetical protein GOP47_0022001 [Adiantum capillus-veneris]|uniref:Glutathione S-transferase n=1 Tax=Adiantum capillus-veneris TaxID=13818 RepID=A0A9D4U8H9_ADICA|nr:hypothetical protein GOP47_0022001 [Adiantum capillus-veneris]
MTSSSFSAAMPEFQLISLGPSHYCEKARWALQRCVSSFSEERHYPGFHVPRVKKLGGGTSLPKLIITGNGEETRVLHDSSDILVFTDTLIGEESLKLYPADRKEAICEWEDLFDDVLGPHVRRWAYCHVLYHKGIYALLSQGAPRLEKVAGFLLLPVFQHAIFKLMGCGKQNAKEISFSKITSVFEKVDEALADGRPFICGDTLTAADVTFASLAGPAVLPKGYGARLPTIEMCPKEMAENIQQLRETPAGKHIMKLYETQRYKAAI